METSGSSLARVGLVTARDNADRAGAVRLSLAALALAGCEAIGVAADTTRWEEIERLRAAVEERATDGGLGRTQLSRVELSGSRVRFNEPLPLSLLAIGHAAALFIAQLNAEFAGKFLDRYLDTLDGGHMVFLQTDVEEFARFRPQLAQATAEHLSAVGDDPDGGHAASSFTSLVPTARSPARTATSATAMQPRPTSAPTVTSLA